MIPYTDSNPRHRFRCRGFFSVLLSDALAKAFQQETYIGHIGLVLFHRSSRIRVEQSHDCGKQYIIQRIYCFFKICYLQILLPLFIIEFCCHRSVLLEFKFHLFHVVHFTACTKQKHCSACHYKPSGIVCPKKKDFLC